MSKTPITIYFHDNNGANIYRLTSEQLQVFADNDDWDGADKFLVDQKHMSNGYAPDWLLTLAELFDFEVDSI